MPWGFAAAGIASAVVGSAMAPGAPDTSGQQQAALNDSAIAARQQDLAEKQYADQKALLDQYTPMLKDQLQKSIDAQTSSTARSDASWNDYLSTWQPVEHQLALQSLDYATPGRSDQEAARAASDTSTQFDRARATNDRSLQMAGASPEKIAALDAASRLDEAKAVGGAQYQARSDTQSKAMSYLDNAARFGRNMPSTGIATASLADAQGQQAQSGYGSLVNATAQPAQSAAPLFSAAVGANNGAGSLFGSVANTQSQADMNTYNAEMGGLAGGVKAYGMIRSSEKSKNVHGKVSGKAASDVVKNSPSLDWSYRPGEGDGNTKRRMGPMAESLADAAPSVSDGKHIDGISMLGLHHAAIGNHAERIAKVEKALSLADAT